MADEVNMYLDKKEELKKAIQDTRIEPVISIRVIAEMFRRAFVLEEIESLIDELKH